jgi:uncharacterized protein involved in exopolysaccharide biosynthesis
MSTEADSFRKLRPAKPVEVPVDESRLTTPEIDLIELLGRLWVRRRMMLALTAAAAIAAAAHAWARPDTYRAEALLMPSTKETSSLDGVAGSVFGLARVAGLDIGGDDRRTALALETLKSRAFAVRFVREHDLAHLLLAADSWDRASDRVSFDPDLYDPLEGKWVRPERPGRPTDPTDTEIYRAFKRRVAVAEVRNTGFVKVSVDFIAPTLAKSWLDWLILDLNRVVRDREAADAHRNITYLERQIPQTPLVEVRKALYELLAEQEQILMLAEAREEFAFKVIDPPAVADEKLGPKRVLWSTFGALAGLALGATLALVLPNPARPAPAVTHA